MVREDHHISANTQRSTAMDNQPSSDSQTTTQRRSLLSRLRRYTPDPMSVDSPDQNHAAPATVIELDDDSFSAAITECITVVDFWAPWCGPCKMLQPRFDDLARAHSRNPRLQFVRVNVDNNPTLSAAYDVMSIPTVIIFDQAGREIEREVGLPGKRRLNQLAKNAKSAASRMNEGSTP